MRRLGEVMSVCPLGKTISFDLPLTSAPTGKLHPGNSVVTSTGSGGAAEEALGSSSTHTTASASATPASSTSILRCKSISIYSPFLVFFSPDVRDRFLLDPPPFSLCSQNKTGPPPYVR